MSLLDETTTGITSRVFTSPHRQVPPVRGLRHDCDGTVARIYGARSSLNDIVLQNDFPQLKYALLGGLGLLALIQRE